MQKKLKRRFIISLALGALVFLALSIFADAGKLASAFQTFHWAFLPVVLACSSANYLFRYVKWDYYTAVLKMRPSQSKNLIIFFAAFIMAVTPGKFGEVLKSYLLRQVNNTPIQKSAPIIIAERLTDFLGLFVLLIAGVYMFGQYQLLVLGFTVAFVAATVLLSWRQGSLAILGLLSRLPFIRRYAEHFEEAYESMYALVQPKPLLIAVTLSVAGWFFECLGYWLILYDFQIDIHMLKAGFLYAFATIFGALTMLPGGLGTTEGSLTGLGIVAGIPRDIAVASTFIIRIATLWFAVLIGVVVVLLFQRKLDVKIADLELEKLK